MKSTKILTTILIFLIIALIGLISIKNRSKIEIINTVFESFNEKKVKIPEYTSEKIYYNFETIKSTDNFEPHSIEDIKNIYFTVLNNGWTDFTFYCPDNYISCKDDIVDFANNSDNLSLLNNFVSPYNSYDSFNTLIVDESEIHLTIQKLYSDDEISYTKNKINEVLNTLNINTNSPSVLDIKLLHNYLIQNTSYDDKYDKNDPNVISNKAYGLFVNKVALCSGYSDTMALFLNELRIPNFKVSSEDHVWNAIYVDNKWMHIDVTWDDDEINQNNNYNFFIITTDELLKLDTTKHTFNINLYKEFQ